MGKYRSAATPQQYERWLSKVRRAFSTANIDAPSTTSLATSYRRHHSPATVLANAVYQLQHERTKR